MIHLHSDVAAGTICKNGGCGQAYTSPASNLETCVHHPGVPVFHEGMKYWSCCNKRTSDFSAFLAQKGCQHGQHKWLKNVSRHTHTHSLATVSQPNSSTILSGACVQSDETESIKCRYDWHQTATTVVLAVYAKMYHYAKSSVKASPVRLAVNLIFPQQNDAQFSMDLELRGVSSLSPIMVIFLHNHTVCSHSTMQIIDVAATKVQFFGTKVEVTMTKAEPGHWNQFEVSKHKNAGGEPTNAAAAVVEPPVGVAVAPNANDDDGIESDVDLDDIEAMRSVTIQDQQDAGLDFD